MQVSPGGGMDNLPLQTRPLRRSQCPAAGCCVPPPPSRTPCGVRSACRSSMFRHIYQQLQRGLSAKGALKAPGRQALGMV